MKKIIIGFSRSTKHFAPFSKAIQWWDDTNYSHVYFQFKSSKYDVDMIYQSSSTMLNYMSKHVFLHHNKVIHEFELEISEEKYDKLMKDCMESAGLEYGLMQVFGIIIAETFCLPENPFSDEEKYHCSEWVAEKLEDLDYKFDKELDLVKPIDIFECLNYEN
jgi:hypothetical protein